MQPLAWFNFFNFDSHRKDAFDFESLSRMDERKRLEHAFNQGEKIFGIPRILDASDVYVERPDKKLIILHLSNMYDYLEGSKAKDQPNVSYWCVRMNATFR